MRQFYKILQLILLAVLMGDRSHSQVTGFPAKDVLTLNKLLNDGTSPEIVAGILAYYYNDPTINASNYKTKVQASHNIFLNKLVVLDKMSNAVGVTTLGTPTGAGSSILGANVTNYADGIAKFLISRGKKELSMAFFENMKKDLKKFPEVRFLFPKTVDILNNVENHNIMTLLQELKDAFTKDLVNEAQNILSLRNIVVGDCILSDANCQTRVGLINSAMKNKPLIISLNLIHNFVEGNTIITGLDKVVNDPLVCSANDEYINYLKFTNILLTSLRTEKQSEGIFVTENTFRTIFSSTELLNLYFGLVYEQHHSNPCYQNLSLGGANLETVFNNILTNHQKFMGTISSLDNINVAYKALSSKISSGEKIENSYYASFVTTSLEAIYKIVYSYTNVMGIKSIPAGLESIFKNIEIGKSLCIDIQQRNYPGIFNSCIKLISDNKIFVNEKSREKTVKYLSFAANLASATNSDEVESVIESVALPPGSYSIKQKSSWNIAINGYMGYGVDFNSGAYAHGFYAPVGIAFSRGLGLNGQWAISLFSSIIDVGGIVSYRLINSETESLKQEVRLESIISPSVQVIFGVPKTPIAICAGWRMSPKLFFSDEHTLQSVPAKNVFNVALLIDIPIFTLFNRPYN
jgi:hypothetical protein